MFNTSLIRVTRGLAGSNSTTPQPASGLGLLTFLASRGAVADSPGVFKSIPNYTQTIGTLVAKALLEGKKIKLTINADFPSDYRRYFAVLRGRYEYKTNTSDIGLKIIYENNDFIVPEDPIEIIDEDVIPGYYYYYSLIALIGSTTESEHFEYNPNTGFACAYAYDDFGYSDYFYNLLPEKYKASDDNTLTERYVGLFGKTLDSIKTDIDVNLLQSQDIWNVRLDWLEYLGGIIGWNPNKELRGEKQREELSNITATYKKKGRNESIKFLIQLITNWTVTFEHGAKRILYSNNRDCVSPSYNNTEMIQNRGFPEQAVDNFVVGSSTGAANQAFSLPYNRVSQIIVEVNNGTEWEEWIEVDSFTGVGATEQVYVVTETAFISTITFGNGTNGAIPATGSNNIRASFLYGGDLIKYSPAGPPSWKGLTGYRTLLKNNDIQEPLTVNLVDKVFNVIEEFKPSYGVYQVLLGPLSNVDNFALFDDESSSFEDTIFTYEYFITNDGPSLTNTANRRTPVIV